MHFLKKNMHLDQTPESEAFAKYLLEVGAGKNSNPDGTITLYPEMHCGDTVDSFMDAIYPGIAGVQNQMPILKTALCWLAKMMMLMISMQTSLPNSLERRKSLCLLTLLSQIREWPLIISLILWSTSTLS
jgi:hypothetical protein